MAKKKSTKDNVLKKRIVVIIISIVVTVVVLIGAIYMYAVNLPEYLGVWTRCKSSSIVMGFSTPLRHEKRYYPKGDQGNEGGPGVGLTYFCSNKEAEDAGYQVYTDLRVR